MIAQVLPYRRTVRGVEGFDYKIPNDLLDNVKVGSLVRIEFRSRRLLGLVIAVDKDGDKLDPRKLKSIVEVLPYSWWENAARLSWLKWFADYYYISLPHAFFSLQFPIIDRKQKASLEAPESFTLFPAEAVGRAEAAAKVFESLASPSPTMLWYSHREDCLVTYQMMCQQIVGHTLIFVPEQFDAVELTEALPRERVRWLLGKQSGSQWIKLMSELEESENNLIVLTTRQGLALPLSFFRTIIVDQEEARSHKQYDANPRFHIREAVLAAYEEMQKSKGDKGKQVLLMTSLSPSLKMLARAADKTIELLDCRRPRQREILIVDMEQERIGGNYSWFGEPVVEALFKSKRALLFLNRAGTFQLATCQSCSQLVSATAQVCPNCGSDKLIRTGRGTEQLEQDLRILLQQENLVKRVLRVDASKTDEQLSQEAIMESEVVIATEKILRQVPLSSFDLVVVLSIDYLLVYPHYQAHERASQIFVRLAAVDAPVILQTSVVSHPVIQALAHDSYDIIAEAELEIRRDLKLPPYGEYVLSLNRKSGSSVPLRALPERKNLSSDVVIDRSDA